MSFKRTVANTTAGLTALVMAGCPSPELESISLPGEFNGVRATDVYEDEIQKAPHERKLDSKGNIPGVYEFNMLPGFEGQEFAPVVRYPAGDNQEKGPFRLRVEYDVNHDGSFTSGRIVLTDFVDNPNTPENEDVWFRDGLPVDVYMQGAAFIGSGRSTGVERFEFNYKYGRSNGQLTDQVDDIQEDLDNHEQNHPPTTQPTYTPAPNNGVCDPGETWRTEYACNVPTQDLVANTRLYFTDANGSELPLVDPRSPNRFRMSSGNAPYFMVAEFNPGLSSYFDRNNFAVQIGSRETGELPGNNCIYGSTAQQTRAGNVYRKQIQVLVPEACATRNETFQMYVPLQSDVGQIELSASADYMPN